MTSKERMLTALRRQQPDRLPITVHQWLPYHLNTYMNGIDQLEAFRITGLDAAVTLSDVVESVSSADWVYSVQPLGVVSGHNQLRHTVDTPDGRLTWVTASNPTTTFTVEHILKTKNDAEIFLKHWPAQRLCKQKLAKGYDRTGDAGIVRGFVTHFAQPGSWQDFCEMVGTQDAIYWAIDDPAFVHHFLDEMTKIKVAFVHEQLDGARYDLIEHGGGAASSNVISPAMFDEFCVPYDRRVIDALHEVGLPVVYHTCGGMMANLEHIPLNGCDASETLSPPNVGGDIRTREDRLAVKRILGSRVALIGGIDQGQLDHPQAPETIAQQVRECFATFGLEGGYICSASDHFFHAPVDNLKALAAAAKDCRY